MNELPTLPDQNPAPAAPLPPPPSTPPADPPQRRSTDTMTDILQRPLSVVVILLALLLAAHAWSTRNKIDKVRLEVARSLQKSDVTNAETGALTRSVHDITKDLQAKVALLENRQLEAQSQQLALEQLYQDLSKNRDEWALAEIEQVLSTASQQLQLAGNVQGALIALQNADRSLSRSDKPQFITIRRAIAKDIEQLRALPALDLTGVALRLDNVINQVDTLPLLSDATPAPAARAERRQAAAPVAPAKPGAAVPVAEPEPYWARAQDVWSSWTSEMWAEVSQLIRIRSVATPEALMLSPTQGYFLRENLKLRLLNARLALLARNEVAFRNDLIAAQEALVKYFDTKAGNTQTVQALLRQVQANNLAIDMPSLSESLNAVRNYKAKP